MSKKTLIIIIAILAVVLVAGIVAIFVLPDPAAPGAADDLISNEPANAQEPDASVQETDAAGEPVETDVPAVDAPRDTGGVNDPTSPTQNPGTADPTAPTKNNTVSNPTNPTKPQQSTTPQPTEPEVTGPLVPGMEEVEVPDSGEVTYEEYYAMSADEQASFINSFESYEAFFAWHTAAKEAYESGRIEIDGTTPIDLGEILGGN